MSYNQSSNDSRLQFTRTSGHPRKRTKKAVCPKWSKEENDLLFILYQRYGPNIRKIQEFISHYSETEIKVQLDRVKGLYLFKSDDDDEALETDIPIPTQYLDSQDAQSDYADQPSLSSDQDPAFVNNLNYCPPQGTVHNFNGHSTDFLLVEGLKNGITSYTTVKTFKGIEIKIPCLIKNYLFVRQLNCGSFSAVALFKEINKETELQPHIYAGKIISKNDQDAISNLPSELLIKDINHPNIVQFHDFIELEDVYIIMTEYCPNGDLLDYITQHDEIDEALIHQFIKQITNIMSYLHSIEISHNDIKLENFLLDANINLKLADFGFAQTPLIRKAIGGSEDYIAPEVLLRKKNCDRFKADIFAFGITIDKLISQTYLCDNEILLDLAKICCSDNPKFRPNYNEIMNHPYFI
ncbi:hypothetical protein M9Y10_020884 [Tritrichomonas musculus]|uniref:Protein kinase domain-containing protein n=1 Tax=Tritrichomonas musculus TaxID=1915356 RepID=A0ABR2HEY8_9EUKA